MHFSLGNTQRGLISAAIISNAAALVAALNDTTDWTGYLCASITAVAMLAGALLDPGSAPAKG